MKHESLFVRYQALENQSLRELKEARDLMTSIQNEVVGYKGKISFQETELQSRYVF